MLAAAAEARSSATRAVVAPASAILARTAVSGRAVPEAALASGRRNPQELRLPCQLFAAITSLDAEQCRELDAVVARMRRAPGVHQVIAYPDHLAGADQGRMGVAVIARGQWLARQGLERLVAACSPEGMVGLAGSLPGEQVNFPHAQVPAAAVPATVPAGGAALDCATIQYRAGRLQLWVPGANSEGSRALAARIAGLPEENVDLHSLGSVRRDPAAQVLVAAVALAKALSPSPVQVMHVPRAVVQRVATVHVGSIDAGTGRVDRAPVAQAPSQPGQQPEARETSSQVKAESVPMPAELAA